MNYAGIDFVWRTVGFPWHSLPQDSVVVDVGGGIGSTSLLLAHAFPHLRFLVQDRPQVATMGEAVRYPCAFDGLQVVCL